MSRGSYPARAMTRTPSASAWRSYSGANRPGAVAPSIGSCSDRTTPVLQPSSRVATSARVSAAIVNSVTLEACAVPWRKAM